MNKQSQISDARHSQAQIKRNNQNPQQGVRPYCNVQANGRINLYLSPLTFILGERQTG